MNSSSRIADLRRRYRRGLRQVPRFIFDARDSVAREVKEWNATHNGFCMVLEIGLGGMALGNPVFG